MIKKIKKASKKVVRRASKKVSVKKSSRLVLTDYEREFIRNHRAKMEYKIPTACGELKEDLYSFSRINIPEYLSVGEMQSLLLNSASLVAKKGDMFYCVTNNANFYPNMWKDSNGGGIVVSDDNIINQRPLTKSEIKDIKQSIIRCQLHVD